MCYSKSYVVSLFKSLQLSHFVHSVDVEGAVRQCERTTIEIDITKFIQAVCGHLKDFLLKRNIELFRGFKSTEEILQEKFQLQTLKQSDSCIRIHVLHSFIKDKFSQILSESFRVVPSNKQFFYCAPNWEREMLFQEPVHNQGDHPGDIEEATPLGSQSWEQGSAATLDTHTSDSVSDLPDEDVNQESTPLFLHFVCTAQFKDQLRRQPVSMLPTCLGELEASLDGCDTDFEVFALKLYLDVECLTLPATELGAIDQPPNVPPTLDTSVSSTDSSLNELKTEEMTAKLCYLPDHQQKAMTNTIKELNWLLQDEMAAFLLEVFPLSEPTLRMVAQHVERSHGRPSCLMEKVPLHFVYGAEHSMEKFLQMFSSMSVHGYYLRKEGKYYYLVEDKSSRKKCSQNVPHGMKSLATPSSLAEDSSELWNLCFPLDPNKPFSGLYSDTEMQPVYMMESTPTDELMMSRPFTDSKLQSPLGDTPKLEDEILRRERKISSEYDARRELRTSGLDNQWGESCSSSVPTPSLEMPEKDELNRLNPASEENSCVLGSELMMELWDVKARKQQATMVKSGRESPVSRHHNLRARHNSGAPSTPGPNSEVSSLVESGQGTEDGYEGDSSDEQSADDLTGDWLLEHEGKRISLPNFWLIMEVTKDSVITYFHCRSTGQGAQDITLYKDTRYGIIQSILSSCKLVNQVALLQSLHNTRMCDDLLEPEPSNDPWKQDENKSKTGAESDLSHESSEVSFTPGLFACNVVWETQFILHPRLKTGPAKRGIQALNSVLTRFSVNNRKNMFVYQDNAGNVFYLRLQESMPSIVGTKLTPPNLQGRSTDGEATPPGILSVSRSPSISSLMARKTPAEENQAFKMELRPRVRSFGERDSNAEGLSSPLPSKIEDSVVLKVHGISDAGPAIKEELVQVLQNRLADAVLELLCVMLSRNPMCKLTPEDVHFIQKPHQSAHTFLEYTIQPYALFNLQAMVYYLRQNLLQFLHTPKYTDNRPENHFQDYSRSNMSTDRISEDDIYLYNQSATCGSRGMACIALAVVDCRGHLIQHERFPKPSAQPELDMFYKSDFNSLTNTKPCNMEETPPAARVEFRIWKQGRVNLDLLGKKLQSAIQHAAWDILMEFHLLTAPLAQEIPINSGNNSKVVKDSNLSSSVTTPTSSLKREFSGLCPPDSVDKFEAGEAGQMHKIYQQIVLDWLNFAIEIGVPAVKKHAVVFKARQSLAVSLKELQRLVSVNASDTAVAVFKLINQEIFVPYQSLPSFASDSRWDDANTSTNCLLIGRNLQQWKACISEEEGFDPDVLYPKAQKVFQKFPPLVVSSVDKSSSGGMSPLFQFVPRQRLLVANLSDTEVTILTYNWSKDRSENLNRQVSNLGHWLVARSSLTTSIVGQKMGLFNNQAFNRQCNDSRKGVFEQCRLSVKDIEQLVKSPATAQKEFVAPGRRSSVMPTVCIQEAFRDNKPSKSTLRSSNNDAAWCNGQQLLELCNVDKKENQKKLCQLWQTRVATPNIPVAEDVLQLLKQHSRVIHYCLTPLLFLPSWRIQAAATRDHNLASTGSQKPDLLDIKSLASSHSRHESGNSMKSAEGSRSTKSNSSPQISPKTRRSLEDKWHQKLCTNFIQEYKQYLQTLGFVAIQTEAPSPKKGLTKSGAASGTTSKEDRQRKLSGPAALSTPQPRRPKEETSHFLQKSLLGGILIFEIMLHEPFFQAKLHALECSRLQSKTTSGLLSQFTFSFLDECDKIKILMHLHSFTYDYHLRCIHNYVSNQQSILRNHFHLCNFLDDFIKYYSKGPNFARNLVYSDKVIVPQTSTPALQLYNFLWTHEDLYEMEVCCMSPESDSPVDNEYVLVQLKNTHHITYKDSHDVKQTDDFDVTLIVAHEQVENAGQNTLHLKYYIILTSRREHFPKHIIERKLGKFCNVPLASPPSYAPTSSLPIVNETESPENEEADPPEMNESSIQQNDVSVFVPHVEIKQEAVNYMGYYSSHEQLMQQLILQQAEAVQEQVKTMVQQGMVHCRTHILWETLLSSVPLDDKTKRKELSYEEFCELLKLASVESLSLLDHRLGPLLCQSLPWYQSLDKVMATKYGTDVVRRFLSPDASIQHTVILATHYLEAFMMLSIDVHTSRGELSIVCKKTPQIQDSTTTLVHNLRFSPTLQTLIEGFVNACCFHLWAGLV